MKIQGVSVWPVKKESFWAKFWCRVNFSTANDTVVFDKSAMYDISFSSKNLTVYIYASIVSVQHFR